MKSFHQSTDSGELDVFEATSYFSGDNGAYFSQKMMREDRPPRQLAWTRSGGRISLDIPMTRNSIPAQAHNMMEKPLKEIKKHKQPSSPGGRLASFLNSLFSQSSSKKKKSKSLTQSMKDEDESPGGRRKRRSSISHFRNIYSSKSSGFRTPPPYSKSTHSKDFQSYSDHRSVVLVTTLSKNNFSNGHVKSSILQNEVYHQHDQDFKFSTNYGGVVSEKHKTSSFAHGFLENPSKDREFKKFNKVDDGADSDSSSDLFELQNYDLGCYSSGLPVYETTHMDCIKIGAPITSAAAAAI